MVEYRDIPGFPGYRVGNDGSVWSCLAHRGTWMQMKKLLKLGYVNHWLRNDGKRSWQKAHRLVLLAFVGPCPEGMEACHNDGNPANNVLSNLRWGTRQENMDDIKRHGRTTRGERSATAKLTEEQVLKIRLIRDSKAMRRQAVADLYGVSIQLIDAIAARKVWKHVA